MLLFTGLAFCNVCEKIFGTGGHWLGLMENDGLGAHLLAVCVLIGSVVSPESGTRKGDSGENSTRTRIGNNLGVALMVRETRMARSLSFWFIICQRCGL